MAGTNYLFTFSGTSPTGTTAATVIGSAKHGLFKYDWFTVDANLKGAVLGTLDVYLQRQVAEAANTTGGVWADWLHFPQLAAGAARVYYSAQCQAINDITVVGNGTDASAGTPALAANTSLGGHPGDSLRLVAKAGSVTNTGTSITVRIRGWQMIR